MYHHEHGDERDSGAGRGREVDNPFEHCRSRLRVLQGYTQANDEGREPEELADEAAPETTRRTHHQEDDQCDIDAVHIDPHLTLRCLIRCCAPCAATAVSSPRGSFACGVRSASRNAHACAARSKYRLSRTAS